MTKEFTKLIAEHQAIIHKICNIYFWDKSFKEDYFQEIVIEMWKAYPSFQNKSKFSTWMYRVALNTAIDILRKEKNLIKTDPLSKKEFNIPAPARNPQDTKQEKLYMAINQLSDIEKAIIMLYLDDYSYKEIAGIVGISETYTGVKINRIKTELQKKLNHGNK